MTFPQRTEILNHQSSRRYYLCRADGVVNSDESRKEICSICNQRSVYDSLFAELLQGRPYSVESAGQFLKWAHKGWKAGSHFVFLLTTENNEVVGAMDIKSPSREAAEIGYWASENHPGNMTNALRELCALAKDEGFRRFIAYVGKHSAKSVRVLERVGFENDNDLEQRKGYASYSIALG